MKSSSHKLAEYGINLSIYRDCLQHEWYLKPQYSEKLDTYILRESKNSEFFFHMKDGILKVKGRNYSVVWNNKPNECREAEYLLISLRYCPIIETGYALVRILKGDGRYEQIEY